MSTREKLYVVSIRTSRAAVPFIEAGLDAAGIVYGCWTDEDVDYARFDMYHAEKAAAGEQAATLTPLVNEWLAPASAEVTVTAIRNRDWQESWKEFFQVERVSPRIVIKPSWQPYDALNDDCVVELDPGMSFGTGQHPTTRACLRFIDALARERPGAAFLDIGCGSGILSIAAARLGFTDITAVDIAEDAVRITRENCVHNGVGEAVTCAVGDLATWRPARCYDVVAANILAHVLRPHTATIAAAVAPGGCLMLAGMLREQLADVCDGFIAEGFTLRERVPEKEWESGLLVKRGPE